MLKRGIKVQRQGKEERKVKGSTVEKQSGCHFPQADCGNPEKSGKTDFMRSNIRRFYIDDIYCDNGTVEINPEKSVHIVKALRLGPGDMILLFDRLGRSCKGEIETVRNGCVMVKVREWLQTEPVNRNSVVLCQAVPKGSRMNLVVQKSTEIGVTSIVPFFSSRCVPRWEGHKCSSRVEHWNRIAASAIEQSGIGVVPVVEKIMDFKDMCLSGLFAGYQKLIFYESETRTTLRQVLLSKPLPDKILFAVGPEGGFTEEEVRFAEKHGFVSVGFGRRILRTETMCLAVLSIIRYEYGELG